MEAWLLFTSEKHKTWTFLKWVSYINENGILLDKVGTLFTLTEGVDEDWHRHNIGGQNSLTLFEPGRSAVEFQLPVNSFKIFGKEIWAMDIHGRLGLICPNAELYKVNSKLSKTLTCRHLERRTFKYPIQKVVTLDNIAAILL